jgi:hypothetical protein
MDVILKLKIIIFLYDFILPLDDFLFYRNEI